MCPDMNASLDDAARFIGTMNYGYAGTRELNEALVSRFVVLDMPVISDADLQKLLPHVPRPDAQVGRAVRPAVSRPAAEVRQRRDLHQDAGPAGLLAALRLIREGIPTGQALKLGIINKAFEPFLSGSWRRIRCGPASPRTPDAASCSESDMDRQELQSRRAANQIWNGAGRYDVPPEQAAFDADGDPPPVYEHHHRPCQP